MRSIRPTSGRITAARTCVHRRSNCSKCRRGSSTCPAPSCPRDSSATRTANHPFAWRPAHIHFSLMGNAPIQRLVTQMYFPGDPLLALDPVYNSVPDEAGRKRLISTLSLETGVEGFALGYRFDIVLAGAKST